MSIQPGKKEYVGASTRDANSEVKVLLIHLEFSTWSRARAWTYSAQLGFEEGFKANGVNFVTMLALEDFSPDEQETWFTQVRAVCASTRFDQVWIELVHLNLDDRFLAWLSGIAPVRVALIGESLEYSPDVYAVVPVLLERRALVERRLRYMTHALVADEKDEERLNANGPVKAMWWQTSVPKRFVCTEPPLPEINRATFFGALYGERKEWLSMDILKDILVRTGSVIDTSPYPRLFDEIHAIVVYLLRHGIHHAQLRDDYLAVLRRIRQELFALILDDYRTGCAVINLPHFVQAYSGRVVEAMAAGRPVISWEIPDRPRTRAIFEENVEIFLFPKHKPEVLASHIRRIQNDPEFGQTIAAHARDKVLQCFTTEKFVKRILEWLNNGELIDHFDEEHNMLPGNTRYEPCDMTDIDILRGSLYSNMKSLCWRDKVVFRLLSCKREFGRYLLGKS